MKNNEGVSGEPLPELSPSTKAALELQLQRLGVTIVRSKDRLEGWEDAYNALAEAFVKEGGKLSNLQLEIDLPNILFNFAARDGWFLHLKLLARAPYLPDITSPKRMVPPDTFAKRDHRGIVIFSTKQSWEWFKDRIRPAVKEWALRATEFGNEPGAPPTKNELITSRERLLEDYNQRIINPKKNKPYTNYALYNARQHSMHKPQFYEWKNGTLADDNSATLSFERFLRGKDAPIARTKKQHKH